MSEEIGFYYYYNDMLRLRVQAAIYSGLGRQRAYTARS